MKKPTKKFNKHLAQLYDYYKANMDGIPTGDQIINGVVVNHKALTFDQQYALNRDVVDSFAAEWIKNQSKHNMVTNAKLDRLLGYIEDQDFESKVLVLRWLLVDHELKLITLQHPEFGRFLNQINDVLLSVIYSFGHTK